MVDVRRLTLLPREAAVILRRDVAAVRRLMELGELRNVSNDRFRRIDSGEFVGFVAREVENGRLPHVALVELARLLRTPR